MNLFGGTWMYTNLAESEVQCCSGVKTAQNTKAEGGIENMKMWSWRKMCLGRFYFEKNQKNANPCVIDVQLQISVPKQTYIFLPLVFFKIPDQGSSWSYLCTKAHNNLHVLSKFKVAARLVSQNDTINARVLSFGPRLSLFSEVSYWFSLDSNLSKW